jgi:hypothetical protein
MTQRKPRHHQPRAALAALALVAGLGAVTATPAHAAINPNPPNPHAPAVALSLAPLSAHVAVTGGGLPHHDWAHHIAAKLNPDPLGVGGGGVPCDN